MTHGEIKPHLYMPDYQAMGDCRFCGHDRDKPWHLLSSRGGLMSNELYLVAHKVRGEPAFDIAQHLTCPKCEGTDDHCTACDGAGHWWIIPTSGHRAWPFMTWRLNKLCEYIPEHDWQPDVLTIMGPAEMHPEFAALRDHYTTQREASTDLIRALGLVTKPATPPTPQPIHRRF